MKIPSGALIWYNINDIKISDAVRKERIHDLRKKQMYLSLTMRDLNQRSF